MEIRLLEPEDASTYRKLRLEALLNSPEAFLTSYEEAESQTEEDYRVKLQSDGVYNFGAFEGDTLIGMVALVPETKEKINHRSNVFAMYVTPASRGKGIGKKLMQSAIEYAKSLGGVEQISISVVTQNTKAKSMYYALGFVPFGTHKKAVKFGDGFLDEEYMVMVL
ncbi:GNAT family N-acetyltransferase [Virgibacillus siamensis]|uniref:GNAT family N-acetyltransferase n=1 Tax=Virgibacillus siamensis TaxID=480071 RepID=UPI000985A60F|nr:GNAT family N-acetyltransferase [Virgibacillus siamensis]